MAVAGAVGAVGAVGSVGVICFVGGELAPLLGWVMGVDTGKEDEEELEEEDDWLRRGSTFRMARPVERKLVLRVLVPTGFMLRLVDKGIDGVGGDATGGTKRLRS